MMMKYGLTLSAMLRRAEELFGHKEVVTRRPDGSLHRYKYADFVRRSKKLAVALGEIGVGDGDRVATLSWNHYHHFEAYFGIPLSGGVLHTLNLRLHPEELAYIVNHARDKVLIVDDVLLPLYEKFADGVSLRKVIVVPTSGEPSEMLDKSVSYEDLISGADEDRFVYPEHDENRAAAMCYTSGTTGRPKGVLYSHRAIYLHSLGHMVADAIALSEADVTLPVVPMFHANAWGLPFSSVLSGAKQVFPGPDLAPEILLGLFAGEGVTITAGVPTLWLDILAELDRDPKKYDLSALRYMLVGGAAAPEAMIRGFGERHGLDVMQGWGMTETTPLATVANLTTAVREAGEDERYAYKAMQGRPLPLVELRARGEEGFVPWDGRSMGELEVKGPWVAASYYEDPEGDDKFAEDGWLKTGDIATIDEHGFVKIQDRTKDLIKSGGEWISSVELENAVMSHPAVAEAAVVAVPHERWQERPLAAVVLKDGQEATEEELLEHIAPKFAKWWLPDRIEFVNEIPKTSVGKFKKSALRERFAGSSAPAGAVPESPNA